MILRKVPIEVSARHIHLTAQHFKALFGTEAELGILKNISQPGQFSAKETVLVVGPKGQLQVRIVGPLRDYTQVELSATDCLTTGIIAPCRLSGDIKGTPGCTLVGPVGKLTLEEGVIIAHRHLHISPKQASAWGLKHDERISIKIEAGRPLTFHDVYVKSREGHDELSFMIDTDEANAAGLTRGLGGDVSSIYGTIVEN